MKKADSNLWWIIIGAVIVIVAALLILIFFSKSGGKLFGNIDDNIAGLSDKDCDNVADIYDKCDCNPSIGEEFEEGVTECGSAECPESCP